MIPPEIEALANLGWRIHPASQYSRAACIKDAAALATYDLDQLDAWAREFPRANWRVVMGGSGIWALDVDAPSADHKANGIAEMARLVAKHGPLPPGPRIRTGGGGCVLIFRHNGEPISGKSGHPFPGLDPRRGPLTVTLPPSIHITTKRPYSWLTCPWEVNPPDAPAWLLEAVKPPPEPLRGPPPDLRDGDKARNYAVAALKNAITRVVTAPSGTANHTLNAESYSMARFLRDGHVTEGEIRECMIAAARARSIPIREALATIDSGIRSRCRA